MTAADFEILNFSELKSTNDTAVEYSRRESGQRLVICAKRQTAGRGRRGRVWQSLDGNLFFSLLLEFELKNLGALVMAASLSLLETVKLYDAAADVKLKWPNDVLLNNAKVSGMLLEKGAGEYMIVGIGVNIAQYPQTPDMIYAATSLQEAGIQTTAADFLQKYLRQFSDKLKKLETNGVADLRRRWIENAKGIGEEITVHQEGSELRGVFEGIDENADLLLKSDGEIQRILAGDVFYVREK